VASDPLAPPPPLSNILVATKFVANYILMGIALTFHCLWVFCEVNMITSFLGQGGDSTRNRYILWKVRSGVMTLQ